MYNTLFYPLLSFLSISTELNKQLKQRRKKEEENQQKPKHKTKI